MAGLFQYTHFSLVVFAATVLCPGVAIQFSDIGFQ